MIECGQRYTSREQQMIGTDHGRPSARVSALHPSALSATPRTEWPPRQYSTEHELPSRFAKEVVRPFLGSPHPSDQKNESTLKPPTYGRSLAQDQVALREYPTEHELPSRFAKKVEPATCQVGVAVCHLKQLDGLGETCGKHIFFPMEIWEGCRNIQTRSS
jgi:hypothetical protein